MLSISILDVSFRGILLILRLTDLLFLDDNCNSSSKSSFVFLNDFFKSFNLFSKSSFCDCLEVEVLEE